MRPCEFRHSLNAPVGALPSGPRRSSARWASRSERHGGLEQTGTPITPSSRHRSRPASALSCRCRRRRGMGRSSRRYRPPSPQNRGATARAFPRFLFYDDGKAVRTCGERERERGARRGCGTGVGEGSRLMIVRGGSDDDGGSAVARKGDGWDGQERARNGHGRGALPLPRVPCCATLALRTTLALCCCHRLPVDAVPEPVALRPGPNEDEGRACVLSATRRPRLNNC